MSFSDGVIAWGDVILTAHEVAKSSVYDPDGINSLSVYQQSMILDEAEKEVSFFRWQGLCFHGRRYYAAHKAVLMVTSAAGEGTTGSESVGGVSVSKTMAVNNPTAEQGILETHFGRQYHGLLKTVIKRMKRVSVG